MLKHGMVSEKWAYELGVWNKGFVSSFVWINFDLNMVSKCDHPGLFISFTLFNRNLFEFSIYDVRHQDDDEDESLGE